LLVFAHADCFACRTLVNALSESGGPSGRHFLSDADVTLVTDPVGGELFQTLGLRQAVLDEFADCTRSLDIPGTPYAVGVDRKGEVVASGIVLGLPELRDLADRSKVRMAVRSPLTVHRAS
jgi:hypothetical protein